MVARGVTLREYEGEKPLGFELTTEADESRTCTITRLGKKVTHVLIFKGTKGVCGVLGNIDLSLLGTPDQIYESYRLIHDLRGKVALGNSAVYITVPAVLDGDAYCCDRRAFRVIEPGDNSAVSYIVTRTPYASDVDRVSVSFAPTLRNSGGCVSFDELCYTIEGVVGVKYPIHPKLVRDGAFTIYTRKDRNVAVVPAADGSRLRVTLVK